MSKRVKTTYDRGYVNAMDKICVFIESNQKVMYIDTGEYKKRSKCTRGLCQCNRVDSGKRDCETCLQS